MRVDVEVDVSDDDESDADVILDSEVVIFRRLDRVIVYASPGTSEAGVDLLWMSVLAFCLLRHRQAIYQSPNQPNPIRRPCLTMACSSSI